MLKTRVNYTIILIQTMLKNTAAVKHFLDYLLREYNWGIFQIFKGIIIDQICFSFFLLPVEV
jgi:hypothetical protein